MKKLIASLFAVVLFSVSCATLPTDENYNCDLYEKFGATEWNSLIAEKIKDPCLALRIVMTAAKMPAIKWKKDYTQAFEAWAATMQEILADNITYSDLQKIIIDTVAELNKDVGLTILVITDGIFIFNETALLLPKDAELLNALIDHLRNEVKRMEVVI